MPETNPAPTPSTPATPATPAAPPPKRKKRRWILRFFLLFLLLIFTLVALAPTIISTSWGTSFVLSFVKVPGKIEIANLDVGWFSGTKIEGLTIKDPDGKIVLSGDLDAPDAKLFALLRGSRQLGAIDIKATTFDIVAYGDGTNNLTRALSTGKAKPDEDKGPLKVPADLAAKLKITAPKATYAAPGMETATVTDFAFEADAKSPQDIAGKLTAKFEQGTFKSDVALEGSLKDAFDAQGAMQSAKSVMNVKGQLPAPSQLIDDLSKQGGLFVALAGPLVNTKVEVTGTLANMNVKLDAAADRLKLNAVALVSTDNLPANASRRINAAGTTLQFTMTPAVWDAFLKRYGEKMPDKIKALVFLGDTPVDIKVNGADLAMVKSDEAARGVATQPAAAASSAAATSSATPTEPSQGLPILAKDSKLDITITIQAPVLSRNEAGAALRLDNLKLTLKTPENMSAIVVDLGADTMTLPVVAGKPKLDAASVKGRIDSVTTVSNLANDKGRVDFSRFDLSTIKTDSTIANMSTAELGKILELSPNVSGAIGNIDKATIKAAGDGGINIDLKAQNASANLTGAIKDNLITLRRDAVGAVNANDVINKILLIPLTGGLFMAEPGANPIQIKVYQTGFSMPAKDFAMKDVKIPRLDIGLGSLKVKPRVSVDALPGDVGKFLSITGIGSILQGEIDDKLKSIEKYVPTFDSLDASLVGGVLKYNKPLTFKVDKYTFSLNGEVNLDTKVPKMALGIPKAAFGEKIRKYIGNDGYLTLPFTGSFDKPVLDGPAFAASLKELIGNRLIPGLGESGTPGIPDLGGLLDKIKGKEPPKNPDDDKKKKEEKDPVSDLLKGLLDRDKKK